MLLLHFGVFEILINNNNKREERQAANTFESHLIMCYNECWILLEKENKTGKETETITVKYVCDLSVGYDTKGYALFGKYFFFC